MSDWYVDTHIDITRVYRKKELIHASLTIMSDWYVLYIHIDIARVYRKKKN